MTATTYKVTSMHCSIGAMIMVCYSTLKNANTCLSATEFQLQTSYHINGVILEQVNSIKDLGIIVDSKLKFDLYIEEIVKIPYKMLGFTMRATNKFNNIKCIHMLYNALVRSNLDYNSFIWSPHHENQSHQIERVQKNYTRQLAYEYHIEYTDYNDRIVKFGLLTLNERRIYSDMCQLYYTRRDRSCSMNLAFVIIHTRIDITVYLQYQHPTLVYIEAH